MDRVIPYIDGFNLYFGLKSKGWGSAWCRPSTSRRGSRALLAQGADVLPMRLDLERVSYVDAAFIGLVILLQGQQTKQGKSLVLASPQDPVRRIVAYCCAEYLLPAVPPA